MKFKNVLPDLNRTFIYAKSDPEFVVTLGKKIIPLLRKLLDL